VLVLPGCQRFGHTPRNKQKQVGSSEGDLLIELAALNILLRATHYCKSAIVRASPISSTAVNRLPQYSKPPFALPLSLPSPMAVQLPVRVDMARSEEWITDANRLPVMRIQAGKLGTRYIHRYAFFSVVVSSHFVPSIVDQLATIMYNKATWCVPYTCSSAHSLGQAADHTTARAQLRHVTRVRETFCITASTVLYVCSPRRCRLHARYGMLRAHLTSRGSQVDQVGHCVSPPKISELERTSKKLPPGDLPSFFCAFPNMQRLRARAGERGKGPSSSK